jgi:hypothetical protein
VTAHQNINGIEFLTGQEEGLLGAADFILCHPSRKSNVYREQRFIAFEFVGAHHILKPNDNS